MVAEVLKAIDAKLRHQPTVTTKSIKRLRNIETPAYRLRVADWRVFYDVHENIVTVSVMRVLENDPAHEYYRILEEQQKGDNE